MRKSLVSVLVMVTLSSQALAGTALLPQPFQVGEETARYDQGIPTVLLEQKNGAVQITPLPMDHGSIAFTVVVYNDGAAPANFDVSDIRAEAGAQRVTAMTADRLEGAAKNRAIWSQIGVAVLAGAAAVAVSSAHTNYTDYSRFRTPRGTYSWASRYRDNSLGVLGATVAAGAGVAGVVTIQQRLDATVAMLNDQVVQRTTIDPEASYGGRVVLGKIKAGKSSQDVRVAVNWNGEVYRFGLHVPRRGETFSNAMRAESTSRAARRSVAAGEAEPGTITPASAKPTADPTPQLQPATAIPRPTIT
jgi:hypothetical protein